MFQPKHNPSRLSLDNVARLFLLIPLDRSNDRPANSTSSVNKFTWPGMYTFIDNIRRGITRGMWELNGGLGIIGVGRHTVQKISFGAAGESPPLLETHDLHHSLLLPMLTDHSVAPT